jgi:hypothetical protein
MSSSVGARASNADAIPDIVRSTTDRSQGGGASFDVIIRAD